MKASITLILTLILVTLVFATGGNSQNTKIDKVTPKQNVTTDKITIAQEESTSIDKTISFFREQTIQREKLINNTKKYLSRQKSFPQEFSGNYQDNKSDQSRCIEKAIKRLEEKQIEEKSHIETLKELKRMKKELKEINFEIEGIIQKIETLNQLFKEVAKRSTIQ